MIQEKVFYTCMSQIANSKDQLKTGIHNKPKMQLNFYTDDQILHYSKTI
jgi:hypothetical protein